MEARWGKKKKTETRFNCRKRNRQAPHGCWEKNGDKKERGDDAVNIPAHTYAG